MYEDMEQPEGFCVRVSRPVDRPSPLRNMEPHIWARGSLESTANQAAFVIR